ncbi:hypothetical protein [Azospirillum sp. TSO5]|uniref:hypothetical protein n=1 Tax=Azospirillum sp. TSO5 TaxID=716760 RepID=UPI000D6159A8|nr:hypothetical protein [Azospirillum sp. TSO5]PWC96943.1 hypothetical protein TSO5_05795 [Azospirillum sp. TSO5]
MTAAREALERLTKWRDTGDDQGGYTAGNRAFANDVISLLALLEWRPISEAPKDRTTIVRWHKLWKCPVAVERNDGRFVYPFADAPEWVSAGQDKLWPEEAFLPFWKPAGAAPQEDKP